MLPPEYYLNLAKIEKDYLENQYHKNYDFVCSLLRMYLSRRFPIKNDLIHLSNMSKFLQVPQVDLVRRQYKPFQNKLLLRVKKRLRMKKSNLNILVTK